jgi:tetratricopeptide (TPR) repeat protein
MNDVKAWKEIVSIPTYNLGTPEKNPIFLEKRVYQGSSGTVYPLPIIEKIFDEKIEKEWVALFLENKYLKIMILPELGGRVQMAYDKTKQRHFIYYNQVIKPALVGLTGPWISGGIEFNWPQHHRPSTYEPVNYIIEENHNGSKTVWCSEVERMFRTRGMAGFTLYPDKAYLEINVKLYNRTPHPQTFLWWANVAVFAGNEYQSVFPPDVNAVFDHGKRDVSTFPLATGKYYKVDYSRGVDISRYKNIPVPTSFMAIASRYNFLGGYENETKGGLLHVANHHISPGKKQWTWGNGDFGLAWDRNLTDADGPYVELMCGVYTDNQPDFSWIMPYEEKSFTQYFMPYHDLGMVRNATKEAMINLEISGETIVIKSYCTAEYPGALVRLTKKDQVIFREAFDFSPEKSYEKTMMLNEPFNKNDIALAIISRDGKTLVSWQYEKETMRPVPEPAKPVKEPKEISSNEQLYLSGLHLEQYRHATFDAIDYYLEALKREPGDVRNNNAMGLWLMRRGQFARAEYYFKTAITTLTERNPNPYDGEPYYNLGMCLRYQGKFSEAFDAFYKSVWNAACQDSGYFNLAQLATQKGDLDEAMDLVSHALDRNNHNHKARHLKVILLRKLNRVPEAHQLINESLQHDGFNFGILYERCLLTPENERASALEGLKLLMSNNPHNYIEFSLDYAAAGLFTEAGSLLQAGIINPEEVYPMVYYLLGWFAFQSAEMSKASDYFSKAERMHPAYCFPNRLEELLALECALYQKPSWAKASYYLGNFMYANKQYQKAVEYWERSRDRDDTFPIVRRNLALAYYNKLQNANKALAELEKSFSLDSSDHRILMELDQLYRKLGKPCRERLAFLEKYPEALDYRDDLYLERITLYNLLGDYDTALNLIMKRVFHPWEGGEGKVTGQYLFSHIELAKNALRQKNYKAALTHLKAIESYPHNLGEGKLHGAQENDVFYWMGCAFEGLDDDTSARECWEKASVGLSEPSVAMYYNDQQPDKIFYQGLALLKLGRIEEATTRFNNLKDYGEKHISDAVKIDYFAVSLPDMLVWDDNMHKRNSLHCNYLIGLGYLGLGMKERAGEFFNSVLKSDSYHLGSHIHVSMC